MNVSLGVPVAFRTAFLLMDHLITHTTHTLVREGGVTDSFGKFYKLNLIFIF